MKEMSNHIQIAFASVEDAPLLADLLNSAYRGDRSKQGWTTEAHLIAGDIRTNAETVADVIRQNDSVVLKAINQDNQIVGTVNLQKHENRIYLGMFSVSPEVQGGGIGKALLKAADNYAKDIGSTSIYMTVISVRTELINWYIRHGYQDTGQRKPFPEDELTGKHLQHLEFAVLEKMI